MRNQRINSSDVAKLAQVSRSAVSRTFTPGSYVSEETRQRVLRAAEALGYRPNAIARSLTMRRTHLVGIVSGELENPFYAEIVQHLAKGLQAQGFASLLLIALPTEIDHLIPKMLSYQVDGVIITDTVLSSKLAAECERLQIPVILVNRYVETDIGVSVFGDNFGGGAAAADHLIELGHKRISFMAGLESASSSRDREAGFTQQLARHGLTIQSRAVGNYTRVDAFEAARLLLDQSERPEAIFCANDVMAVATMDVARQEFCLDIPQDLSIVGFDNTNLAALGPYRLTSIDQDIPAMVSKSIELLVERIEHPAAGHGKHKIDTRLVVRSSTARKQQGET